MCHGRSVCLHVCVAVLSKDPADSIVCSDVFGTRVLRFDYNDQTYGFCSQSTSLSSSCVNETTQRLHFNHCLPLATHNGQGQ